MAEVMRECLDANPKHLKCLKNYARLMRCLDESTNPDKWTDTADLYARIISLSPYDKDVLFQYALLVQKKLNMPDNAKRAYEMLLDLEPGHQEALIQYSFMLFKQLPPISKKLELPKKIQDVITQISTQLLTSDQSTMSNKNILKLPIKFEIGWMIITLKSLAKI